MNVAATYTDTLTRAVATALDGAPLSLRDIARRTGATHVKLLRVSRGENAAAPMLAEAVAKALATVGQDCTKRAQRLRGALSSSRRRKS